VHEDARRDEPAVRNIQIADKKHVPLLKRQHDDAKISILAPQQNPPVIHPPRIANPIEIRSIFKRLALGLILYLPLIAIQGEQEQFVHSGDILEPFCQGRDTGVLGGVEEED
jgi:hypothetical protein